MLKIVTGPIPSKLQIDVIAASYQMRGGGKEVCLKVRCRNRHVEVTFCSNLLPEACQCCCWSIRAFLLSLIILSVERGLINKLRLSEYS